MAKTLGPVADLERHLPMDWWKKLFNAVYLKTDGDVVENDSNTQYEIDTLLKDFSITPDEKILDLCCGQGRHTMELYRRGFHNVIGIDRSRYLIRIAKRRAQQLGHAIRFSEGDARKVRVPESNLDAVIMMGNSFGYFDSQEDDLCVLNCFKRILKSSGKLALDIVDGDWMRQHFEPRSWEWMDENHFVCRERSLSKDQSRIISREVVVHAEKGVIADQFYAERLYNFSEISSILISLGFKHIQKHAALKGQSSRDQDLGMMSHRMLLTATAPEKAPKRVVPTARKNVLVLMGDPTLLDPVKKGGKFNEEDFETIRLLKETLNQLDDFQFKYFDNHKQMISFLTQHRPEFVFNLCDEGYNNDARKELHVTAILELLNIPYSGAGPQCLAIRYNKSLVRALAVSLDIPVPLETYYDPVDQAATLPSILPAILKPNYGDSSIGITQNAVVYNSEALMDYLDRLKTIMPNTPILIQEFLSGDEFSVGIIGNPGNYTVLPILKVDYSQLPPDLPRILGYESKWLPGSPYWNNIRYEEAKLNPEIERQLIDYSTRLFERLECKDYARFDFRASEQGEMKLLEVNPNPGWCWDGKMNIMATYQQMSYLELLRIILESAVERAKITPIS